MVFQYTYHIVESSSQSILENFHHSKKEPHTHQQSPSISLQPRQLQETTNLPSASMDLLICIVYINEIILYIAFSGWLISCSVIFSRFVYVVACKDSLFLFIAGKYYIVCIYHLISAHSSNDGYLGISSFNFFYYCFPFQLIF